MLKVFSMSLYYHHSRYVFFEHSFSNICMGWLVSQSIQPVGQQRVIFA